MISSLRFILPKTILFITLFVVTTGCTGVGEISPTIMPTHTPHPPFEFMFRIQQQNTLDPIPRVRVNLELEGQLPIEAYSDHDGLVVLTVDANQANQKGYLLVGKPGYRPYSKYVEIEEEHLPSLILLDNENESIAVIEETKEATQEEIAGEVVTNTAVSSTETAVPPTNTIEPIATTEPTNTPRPSTTHTPPPSNEIIAEVTSTLGDTWIYAGPGDGNVRMGSLNTNELTTVLGKDRWGGWYQIKSNDNVEGWVDKTHLSLKHGSEAQIPITWPPSDEHPINTPSPTTTGGNQTQCAKASLDFREWPNEDFDDITVTWGNLPANTNHFTIEVNGNTADGLAPLIYLTKVNPNEKYFIGRWKFTERGFTANSTFTYILEAKNNEDETICATTGTFEQ